jgi:hypothetical protein
MPAGRTLPAQPAIALEAWDNLPTAKACAPCESADRRRCNVQKPMCRQTLTSGARCERQFALSCHPSVGCPPLPCLTLKQAKTSDSLRNMPKRLITASAQTISAQTDCRSVDWALSQTHPQDQANAMQLQTDRGLACRPMRYGPAAALQETVRSTSRARDHRNSPRVWQGHHLDYASAYRWNRNRRPAAC